MFKRAKLLFLFIVLLPNARAQLVSEEIKDFFSQVSVIGEPPSGCLESFSLGTGTKNKDPRENYQKIKLNVKELRKTIYGGDQISVFSRADAQKLFNLLSEVPYLPTKYLEDGCYARAHELMLIAKNNGLDLGKAFIEPHGEGLSLLYPKSMKDGVVLDKSFSGWKYHTSAFIMVEENGVLEPMVLDVGAASRVQSFGEWRQNLSSEPEKVKITTRPKEYIFASGSYKSAEKSIIHNLISTQELIDDIGMDEYIFRLESGWL